MYLKMTTVNNIYLCCNTPPPLPKTDVLEKIIKMILNESYLKRLSSEDALFSLIVEPKRNKLVSNPIENKLEQF